MSWYLWKVIGRVSSNLSGVREVPKDILRGLFEEWASHTHIPEKKIDALWFLLFSLLSSRDVLLLYSAE